MKIEMTPVVPVEPTVTLTLTVGELYAIRKALANCDAFSLKTTNGVSHNDYHVYKDLVKNFPAGLEAGYYSASATATTTRD